MTTDSTQPTATASEPLLQIENLQLAVGGRVLCHSLSMHIMPGQRWALLGRNGSGKTTLLHTLMGLRSLQQQSQWPSQRSSQQGDIRLLGRPLASYSRRELALTMGILFQQGLTPAPATVMETVLLGRHPHARGLWGDSPADRAAARKAIAALGLEALASRQVSTLSGGEAQRTALAMLLAQAPRLYLLDEPGNHIDVAFQMKLMKILARAVESDATADTKTAAASGSALLMATHDINLAARCCTHTLLLSGNGHSLAGPTTTVLTTDALSQAYHHPIHRLSKNNTHLFYPA